MHITITGLEALVNCHSFHYTAFECQQVCVVTQTVSHCKQKGLLHYIKGVYSSMTSPGIANNNCSIKLV